MERERAGRRKKGYFNLGNSRKLERVAEAFADSIGTKQRRRRNGERTRAVLLGAKAAGSGVGYGTKGPRTSRRFFFWTAVHRWISPIQPPIVFVTEISFFFIVPRDFLGNPLPCCKQSNLN
ncbi:hypothetical protein VNO78_35132 [Psophocarpus tetragonolobus]|uniref:Uncharacterized protein n=1 Tax=Psophocarpus tetragonolobus TaxID=3891 RepID=A0AAN9NMZ6_PSOTE